MSIKNVAQLIRRLQTTFAAALLDERDTESILSILTTMPPNQAASVVMHISLETRRRILPSISGKLAENIRELYTYPEGSVGRFMSTDYMTFSQA